MRCSVVSYDVIGFSDQSSIAHPTALDSFGNPTKTVSGSPTVFRMGFLLYNMYSASVHLIKSIIVLFVIQRIFGNDPGQCTTAFTDSAPNIPDRSAGAARSNHSEC